jgi:hypothetical protein
MSRSGVRDKGRVVRRGLVANKKSYFELRILRPRSLEKRPNGD